MIASEADHEDLPAQRYVSRLWRRATLPKFATLLEETVHDFTKPGMVDMLEICQNPVFGPEVRTLVVTVDGRRSYSAKCPKIYVRALLALAVHGQRLRLGIRWRPKPGDIFLPSEMASRRMAKLLDKRILPAASAAGIEG